MKTTAHDIVVQDINFNIKVAFDCDGTLLDTRGDPNYKVIQRFLDCKDHGFDCYIWSGGGVDYARYVAEKLGLNAKIVVKGSFEPDIAFDDMPINLGKVNIRV